MAKLLHEISNEFDTVFLSFSASLLFLCAETLSFLHITTIVSLYYENCILL